ncbi:MAG: peptidase M48 [Haliea sp.]|nr:peptidase M48 [Haliea sp.]
MDFFARQDVARRNTRLLTLLFLLSVAGLILLTHAAVSVFLWRSGPADVALGTYFSWSRLGSIGLLIGGSVALVSLFRWMQLATGGKAVAEALGGTRVLTETRDPDERRALNVVEEMALAAGMPAPSLYVLDRERGINAFAAGTAPANAVIGVTRGALRQLRRHELQGVIAHEFSHILNGDMRLNIRLAALLKGITFIGDVGHFLLRSGRHHRTGLDRHRRQGGPMLPILGLALWILGWLGGVAAGFIKAAISRQKEYLADACAVQYTRDNRGIADALKVIGAYVPGTLVHGARAAELSHIFFGQIEHRLWQGFATHPPLPARIRRLDPEWDGQWIQREVRHYEELPRERGSGEVGVGRAALVTAAAIAASRTEASPAKPASYEPDTGSEPANTPPADTLDLETDLARQSGLPLAFSRQSQDPLGAVALMLSLLISEHDSLRQRQLAQLSESTFQGLATLVNTLAPGINALGPGQRLPLLSLCLPALRELSPQQYRHFKQLLMLLIRSDRRTELQEWCLYQLLRHYLDPEFVRASPAPVRYRHLKRVREPLQVVLSMLAWQGSGEANHTFRLAVDALGLPRLTLLPPADCSLQRFGRAVDQLAACYPLLKPRILKAMTAAAGSDGELTPVERELLASIAAVMDCPLPDALQLPAATGN